MKLQITNKPTNTNSLLRQIIYILHLLNKHELVGRYLNIQIKDLALLKEHQVDFNSLKENFLNLKIIKKNTKKNRTFYSSDYFYINKNKLLIALFLCIAISSFEQRTITKIRRTNFSFDDVYEGIYKTLDEEETRLYISTNLYEQKIAKFVYESLSLVAQYYQPLFIKHNQKQKSRLYQFFEIKDTKSRYQKLLETELGVIDAQHNVTTINELRLELRKTLFSNLLNDKQYILQLSNKNPNLQSLINNFNSVLLDSLSSSTFLPISSSSTSPLYLYNCVVYIDKVVSLLTISLLSHKGAALKPNTITKSENSQHYLINEYLDNKHGFGNSLFRIGVNDIKEVLKTDNLDDVIKEGIVKYAKRKSALFLKINELITQINNKKPLYKFVFKPKVKEEYSLNKKYKILKLTGRSYNDLCDVKSHCRDGNDENSERAILLKRLGYDHEGFDISSTIWTIAKALITGEANINFDLKSELLKLGCKDVNGEVIKDRKKLKPLNQITFFCMNAHHAIATYKSQKVREDFENRNHSKIDWLELDDQTIQKLYYASTKFIYDSSRFIDSIFFYESILELSVIARCQNEGIDVLNVYDCFFLKDNTKYDYLKTIIQEELNNLITFHRNIVDMDN